MSHFFNTPACVSSGVRYLFSSWTVAGAVGVGGVYVGCCPLPVQLSSVGRCRAVVGDGLYSSRAALAASWAAWGCRRASGRGVRCRGAVGAVAGYGGAWVQVVRVRWPWWWR